MHRIVLRRIISANALTCFELSRDIDLHVDSMRATNERAIAGRTSGKIGLYEHVTWNARHLGFRYTMTSRITAMEAPGYFRDEMVSGPFQAFRHAHLFQSQGNQTLMTDIVEFSVPFGILGKLVGRWLVLPHLYKLLTRRNDCIAQSAEKKRDDPDVCSGQ